MKKLGELQRKNIHRHPKLLSIKWTSSQLYFMRRPDFTLGCYNLNYHLT